MIKTNAHSCQSCKGTGKVASQRTTVSHGIKQTSEFLVDCPGKLADTFLQGPHETNAAQKP